jgi:hypothetical protein
MSFTKAIGMAAGVVFLFNPCAVVGQSASRVERALELQAVNPYPDRLEVETRFECQGVRGRIVTEVGGGRVVGTPSASLRLKSLRFRGPILDQDVTRINEQLKDLWIASVRPVCGHKEVGGIQLDFYSVTHRADMIWEKAVSVFFVVGQPLVITRH